MAMERLVDMPHAMKQTMVLISPMTMVGFLPKRSDARPHCTAVRLCENEKTADVTPAHFATSFSAMPKLLIISGKYGNTLVSARGSANLATAVLMSTSTPRMHGGRGELFELVHSWSPVQSTCLSKL
jgi:hypothetical protein